jgi:hypothetical protein
MSNTTFSEQQIQELYDLAVSAECEEKTPDGLSGENDFALLCKLDDMGGNGHVIRKLIDLARANREAK